MTVEQRKALATLVAEAQQLGFLRGRGVNNEASLRQQMEKLSVAYETYREIAEKQVYKAPR